MTSSISRLKQPHELLNHILDQPELPAIIQRLDAGVLTRLIRHVGLEDSAQIISLTTAGQLKGVFDEDLWAGKRPGAAEAFDAERFGLWIEVMLEAGKAFSAQKITELDEDLVVLGLSRLIFVAGFGDATVGLNDNHPLSGAASPEKMLEYGLTQEFGNYRVSAKNPARWDAVCTLLAELNELDYDLLVRLMERCRRISLEDMEDNDNSFDVATADEMLEEDVAADREERRTKKGFVTPTSASVFLSQIRATTLKALVSEKSADFETRAYFKAMETENEITDDSPATEYSHEEENSYALHLKVAGFIQTLRAAEVLPAPDQKLLGYDGAKSSDQPLPLAKAMDFFNKTEPNLYSRLMAELSYLSNTLIAGCRFKGRTFQPEEAALAAFSTCNLGAEVLLKYGTRWREYRSVDAMTVLLKEHYPVKLFQVGWKILFDHVVLYTAKAVLEFLNRIKDEPENSEHRYDISHMAGTLQACITSGRPWEFNDRMDYLLTILDGRTTAALEELLQAYPTLADIISKHGGHPLSLYIGSKDHIVTLRQFLAKVL